MHHPEVALGPPIDVLGQLPVGVMLMDATGEVVHENEALRSLWRGLSHRPPDAPLPLDAHHPDGSVLRPDDWPIRRSLATGEDVREVPIELERLDDEPVSIIAESRPLIDPGGQRIGAVMVVRDVTQAHDDPLLREAFVGMLSHELRTPVTSIYSGIELLRGRRLDGAVVRDVLDDVAVETETLQRLIDDLLVLVRVDRGIALGVPEPVHLRRIVRLAVADEQRRWPGRAFVVDLPADLPAARGDDGMIRQVLRNLLSNAAKYGPPDGIVTIAGGAVGDDIELRVTDDGPGVALEHRQRELELSSQGSTAARIAGAGIGLHVAQLLMEAMGGSIRIATMERGSAFVLHLPCDVDPDAAGPIAAE